MDLVDIDQLINNLELELEVEQGAAGCSNQLHNQRLQNSRKNCNSGKNFVGVSQVFTHLDDYEKNVGALETVLPKYDIERPLPSAPTVESPSSYDGTGSSYSNTPVSFKLNKAEEEDDEEEASSDIKKFTEDKSPNKDFPEFDEQSSSDSLTTSSSSTFSSGPSAGAASTTDDRGSPISPLIDEVRNEEHIDHSLNKVTDQPSLVEQPSTSPIEKENKGAVEDLATGMSSISISSSANSQSILPCETTVSSVLHNVLNELSDQTSISPLSQFREETNNHAKQDEGSESIAVVSLSAAEDNLPKNSINNINAKSELETNQTHRTTEVKVPHIEIVDVQRQQQQQQPITFGSTMDEISDTELDSMLQEMDIDVEVEEVNSKSVEKLSENVCSKNRNDSCNVKTKETPNETDTKVTEKQYDDNIDEGLEAIAPDSMNADSFSQASTVEFSEIRTQGLENIAQTEESIPHYNNSYTSSESSSLEDEQEAALRNGEVCAEEGEMCTSRPQRPTTLDLLPFKANIFTNAGQTPPGNSIEENVTQTVEQTVENENINPPQEIEEASGYSDPNENLGRLPPIWVPDNMATGCMQCQTKFTMIKRRHHCRACGKVLCSVCCSQKFKLEFLSEPESRVCVQCYLILVQRQQLNTSSNTQAFNVQNQGRTLSGGGGNQVRSPNPNNPMEYCSTIPPHRQVEQSLLPPPTVIVPVGVLKKEGSYSSNSSNSSNKQTRKRKSVMFSDGIAPGSELAGMEQHQWGEAKHARHNKQQACARGGVNKPSTPAKAENHNDSSTLGIVAQLFRGSIPPTAAAAAVHAAQNSHGSKGQRNSVNSSPNKSSKCGDSASTVQTRRLPDFPCDEMGCFIPGGDKIPPIYVAKSDSGCDFEYKEVTNNYELMERLQNETLKFSLTRNFFVFVKIVNLKCCLNKTVINFTTSGLHHVGNDEVVVLLEFDPPKSKEQLTEPPLPKDMFIHLYEIYREAEMGNPLAELSYTSPSQERFLGEHDYGGFIFIRPTFQCLQDVILPENPFLIGILIHRSEVPWAKIFPLRLMLRLGAQYRYYPCPHISMRHRESVYAEIAQTIINFLADFRNYSYTLPNIRGMYIHMEDRQTTVLIPKNRQEDIIKAMNNASDHILAFAGNFSKAADGHLVCMQNTNDDRTEMYSYSTQAINIQGQPRKVTGASFFVLNESLKSTSGLLAKCSIVEDGLMVQILPSKMEEVRNSLSNQKDIEILCGPVNAEEQQREIVSIKWVDNDKDFNIGVKSPIDDKSFEGISSMRVHASFNYANANYSIRLTDIFILKYDDWYYTQASKSGDITRIAEQIARSASMALVPLLDMLAESGSRKIGIRATLHQDNVCYEAGAQGSKLSSIYMNALDNNLIPILHNESAGIEEAIILELIFYILNA